jgi:hypothetical protein
MTRAAIRLWCSTASGGAVGRLFAGCSRQVDSAEDVVPRAQLEATLYRPQGGGRPGPVQPRLDRRRPHAAARCGRRRLHRFSSSAASWKGPMRRPPPPRQLGRSNFCDDHRLRASTRRSRIPTPRSPTSARAAVRRRGALSGTSRGGFCRGTPRSGLQRRKGSSISPAAGPATGAAAEAQPALLQEAGARALPPMLWLYAENDKFRPQSIGCTRRKSRNALERAAPVSESRGRRALPVALSGDLAKGSRRFSINWGLLP